MSWGSEHRPSAGFNPAWLLIPLCLLGAWLFVAEWDDGDRPASLPTIPYGENRLIFEPADENAEAEPFGATQRALQPAEPEACEEGAQVDAPVFARRPHTRSLHRALIRTLSAGIEERGLRFHLGPISLRLSCRESDCHLGSQRFTDTVGPFEDSPLSASLQRHALADIEDALTEARANVSSIVPWLGVIIARTNSDDEWTYRLHILPSLKLVVQPPDEAEELVPTRSISALISAHRQTCQTPSEITEAADVILAQGARVRRHELGEIPEVLPPAIRALLRSPLHYTRFIAQARPREFGVANGDTFIYDASYARSISICDHEGRGSDPCGIGRTTPERFAASTLLATAVWNEMNDIDDEGVVTTSRRLGDSDWARVLSTLTRLDPSVDFAGFWYL